jgi:hypothetical protein
LDGVASTRHCLNVGRCAVTRVGVQVQVVEPDGARPICTDSRYSRPVDSTVCALPVAGRSAPPVGGVDADDQRAVKVAPPVTLMM